MLRVETWMLSTLFAFGVIAGMVWLNLAQPEAAPMVTSKTVQKNSESQYSDGEPVTANPAPDAEAAEFVSSSLQRGDRYLIAGNYQAALSHYRDVGTHRPSDDTSVLLREAFCYELSGWYPKASDRYHRSIATAQNDNHRLLAITGYARCLLRDGKQGTALETLVEPMLRIEQYTGVPVETRSWLSYLYARVIETAALLNAEAKSSESLASTDLTLPHSVVFDKSQITPDLFLSVVDQPCEDLTTRMLEHDRIIATVVQRPGDSIDMISLSVGASLASVETLAAQLTEEAQLSLKISPLAAAILKHKSRTVQLEGASLSLIMDALLLPYDLAWFQSGREIRVMTMPEIAESDAGIEALSSFRFDTADRALRWFELEFQTSEFRHAALLSRGNLMLIQKRYGAAANRYQELELTLPNDEMLASLFFNQAKLHLLLGQFAEARRFLYMAIDQTGSSDVESSGYCLLSSSLLAEAELDSAITTARRGIATAVNARQTRWATLNLARAYLLVNDPFAANDALFRSRDAFAEMDSDDPVIAKQRKVASLLGAYARFRGVSDERRIQAERLRMLSAIAMIDDAAWQSFADCYVASQAYRELGFDRKATEKMILALAKPDVGQWRRQLLFELGQLQKKAGRIQEAIYTFELLTETSDRWRTASLENLVTLYADQGDIERSVEGCRLLWKLDLNEHQKTTTLMVLGHAFQLQGEHHSAALCFAGILPDIF